MAPRFPVIACSLPALAEASPDEESRSQVGAHQRYEQPGPFRSTPRHVTRIRPYGGGHARLNAISQTILTRDKKRGWRFWPISGGSHQPTER